MRGTIIISLLLFLGFLAWRITDRLSPDALGLATGVLLGVLAGLPVAILMLAASRRRARHDEAESERYPARHGLAMQQPQPPVIILSGMPQGYGQPPHAPQGGYAAGPRGYLPQSEIVDSRRFHVVGEEAGEVEEW